MRYNKIFEEVAYEAPTKSAKKNKRAVARAQKLQQQLLSVSETKQPTEPQSTEPEQKLKRKPRKQIPVCTSIGCDPDNPWSSSSNQSPISTLNFYLRNLPPLRITEYLRDTQLSDIVRNPATCAAITAWVALMDPHSLYEELQMCVNFPSELFALLLPETDSMMQTIAKEFADKWPDALAAAGPNAKIVRKRAKRPKVERAQSDKKQGRKRKKAAEAKETKKKNKQQSGDQKDGESAATTAEIAPVYLDEDSERRRLFEDLHVACALFQSAFLPIYARRMVAGTMHAGTVEAFFESYDGVLNLQSGDWRQIPCEGNLVDLTSIWYELLYSHRDHDSKRPLKDSSFVKILIKALPRKNSRRKFDLALARELEDNENVCKAIFQWLLCMLLGHYHHSSTATRLNLEQRWFVTAYLTDGVPFPVPTDPVLTRTLQWTGRNEAETRAGTERWLKDCATARTRFRSTLFTKCRSVFEICLHAYTCYLTDNCPAIEQHSLQMLNYEQYRSITRLAEEKIREYFQRECSYSGTLAPQNIAELLAVGGLPADKYSEDLENLLTPLINKLVRLSERKLQEPFVMMCASLESESAPDIAEPEPDYSDLSPPWESQSEQSQKQKQQQASTRVVVVSDMTAPPTSAVSVTAPCFSEIFSTDRALLWDPIAARTSKQFHETPKLKLPYHICSALFDICVRTIECINADKAFSVVLDRFELLGSPMAAVAYLRSWMQQYQSSPGTKDYRVSQLARLRSSYPYTFRLVQATAVIFTKIRSYKRFPLPLQMTRCQIEAVRERAPQVYQRFYPADVPDALSDSDCKTVLCTVCAKSKTALITNKSVTKSSRTHGSKGVCTNFWDEKALRVECHEKEHFAHRRCIDTTVSAFFSISYLVERDNQVEVHCPQRKCGRKMVLDPCVTIWNERGPACWICTKQLLREQYTEEMRQHPLARLALDGAKCFLCDNKTVKNQKDMRIMGHNLILCKNHNAQRMIDFLESKLPSELLDDFMNSDHADAIGKCLIEAHKAFKREKQLAIAARLPKTKAQIVSADRARQNHWGWS